MLLIAYVDYMATNDMTYFNQMCDWLFKSAFWSIVQSYFAAWIYYEEAYKAYEKEKEAADAEAETISLDVKEGLNNHIPDNKSIICHIFRNAEGHVLDSPQNRELLENVANDVDCFLGKDKYGNEWYAKILEDGRQVWVEVRNNVIFEGGINEIPKIWNPDTGFKKWE